MSFILDALRKADAERARGALPDLHTQPVLHASSANTPRRPWLAIGAGVVMLVAAAAVATGWLMTPRTTDRPIAVATVALAVPVASAALPGVAAAPAPLLAAPFERRTVGRAADPRASASPSAPPPPAPPTEARVYALAELPEPIRRELPMLAVGGAMHSDNPASRMLILNGQVFHEGDRLAANLTLVQIQLKSALLDFRGYRYRITY